MGAISLTYPWHSAQTTLLISIMKFVCKQRILSRAWACHNTLKLQHRMMLIQMWRYPVIKSAAKWFSSIEQETWWFPNWYTLKIQGPTLWLVWLPLCLHLTKQHQRLKKQWRYSMTKSLLWWVKSMATNSTSSSLLIEVEVCKLAIGWRLQKKLWSYSWGACPKTHTLVSSASAPALACLSTMEATPFHTMNSRCKRWFKRLISLVLIMEAPISSLLYARHSDGNSALLRKSASLSWLMAVSKTNTKYGKQLKSIVRMSESSLLGWVQSVTRIYVKE